MADLVLPTSVTKAPGFRIGFSAARYSLQSSVGVQRKMMSQAESYSVMPVRIRSTVPSLRAVSSLALLRM